MVTAAKYYAIMALGFKLFFYFLYIKQKEVLILQRRPQPPIYKIVLYSIGSIAFLMLLGYISSFFMNK